MGEKMQETKFSETKITKPEPGLVDQWIKYFLVFPHRAKSTTCFCRTFVHLLCVYLIHPVRIYLCNILPSANVNPKFYMI